MTAAPAELAALRERMAEIADLRGIGALLFWDQNTMMPPAGAPPRSEHLATLQRTIHGRLTDPELSRLLDALQPWADGEDPDGDDVRLLAWVRRDVEKAVRVPADLAADMSRAAALGQRAWQDARGALDFGVFRDPLARQIELRHRYAGCFEGTAAFAHPYDVLLDDFEPGLTIAELQPLLAGLQEALVPLVAEAGEPQARGVLDGDFPLAAQRELIRGILATVGFDPAAWRLDESVHPFAQGVAPTDVRITTRWADGDLGMALYSVLHEFGHGLYEAQVAPALLRTTLDEPVSLGVHESQSRLWENVVGRSRAFCAWLLPLLRERFGGAVDGLGVPELYRGVNRVHPSPVRIEADETTYNLHVVLRVELELALMEGRLEVADLPAAWDEGMQRLLGVEPPNVVEGVLQDIHWGSGLIGYFPTYTLGNLIAAQLWVRLIEDVPAADELLERGEFGFLREWLGERVHRHGRKFPPRELLRRITGEDLRVDPFLRYLRDKLADAGVLATAT